MKIEIDVQPCGRKFFIMPGTTGQGTTPDGEPLELLVAGRDIYIAIGESVNKRHYLLKLDDIVTMVAELDDGLAREKREKQHQDYQAALGVPCEPPNDFEQFIEEEGDNDVDGETD